MNVIEALVVGFTVGLTGAMAPGPMLIATIEHSIKEGWRAGPKVVMGHATLEVGIFILIVYGVYSLVQQWVSGTENDGFRVEIGGGWAQIAVYESEQSDTSKPPELTVVYQ